MDYTQGKNPDKAIFAVRDVVHSLPIYQTRGMACAVDAGKKQGLLTWEGVFNEGDRGLINKKSVIFNRRSKTFSIINLTISQIKKAGRCLFISVEGLQRGDVLTLNVPDSVVISNDVCAQSFIGRNKSLKFYFNYNQGKKCYELRSFDGKNCAIEKSAVLGSPIIKDKCVIGVVREDDEGQLIPYFITQRVLDQINMDPSESGNGENQNNTVKPDIKDSLDCKGMNPKDIDSSHQSDILDAPGSETVKVASKNNLQQLQDMISESKLNSYEGSSPRRELEKAVSEWGFRISENAGSGNCLFFALSEQLNVVKGENIQHDELRKNLVRYLRENPKRADRTDLYVLLDDEQRSQFSTWDQYLANMEKDGVWGDEFIIFAAANRYETCIDLIGNKSKNNIRPEFPVEDGRPLCLGHQYDHHFVSLLLKDDRVEEQGQSGVGQGVINKPNIGQNSTVRLDDQGRSTNYTPKNDIPEEVLLADYLYQVESLSLKLNFETKSISKNWKDVAIRFEVPYDAILLMENENKKVGGSAMSDLMQYLQVLCYEVTLKKFVDVLQELGRNDVANDIIKMFREKNEKLLKWS
ncbi:uncharacterized protein LOC111343702 isoform X2 [Stylophora pistillata]|uniref:uncharacterized protein LOC111343702 isoform X2 n=1 Tax=Stylophora pistillata TaxID=50429 RepID=UPI000C040F15|nr:uncharacterized protein LOC111343702 isoform X2 [Stylophora pistillata]